MPRIAPVMMDTRMKSQAPCSVVNASIASTVPAGIQPCQTNTAGRNSARMIGRPKSLSTGTCCPIHMSMTPRAVARANPLMRVFGNVSV